jgi:hypothetical protein
MTHCLSPLKKTSEISRKIILTLFQWLWPEIIGDDIL